MYGHIETKGRHGVSHRGMPGGLDTLKHGRVVSKSLIISDNAAMFEYMSEFSVFRRFSIAESRFERLCVKSREEG